MIPNFDKKLFEEDHGILGGGCSGRPRGHRRVVCAANRMSDGTLFIGARHWDELMHAQAQRYIDLNNLEDHEVGDAEQGFIDQWGVFMDREEAWKVAEAANQILFTGPGFSGPELFSENLY